MKSILTTSKGLAAIFAVILAVLLFFAYKANPDPAGNALNTLIFAGIALAGIVVTGIACFNKISVVFRVVSDEPEPKPGYAGPPSAPYPPRNHRHDLEHALVHALVPGLMSRIMDGKGIGEFIRATADSIQGSAQSSYAAKVGAYTAKVDAVADQIAEAEILAAGLTAPRVTAEQIQALMASLSWRYEQPEGTTSTFAHAFLGRFYLATGHSACVSPENFDAVLGMKYAREHAEGKARDKLWELEGWALHSRLSNIRNNSDEPIPA